MPQAAATPSLLSGAEIERFFAALAAREPSPRSDLVYTNPFTLLVAVVLSAQATDAGVNKATRELFALADTPAAMADLGEDGIRAHIKSVGLFNTKARNVHRLSRILVDAHGGQVPGDRATLEALPGVGRKTANVVLNNAFGMPVMAVDTHVFRVANRTGLAPGRTPEAVERTLDLVVPEPYRLNAHHWLIRLGRYVCKARRPECPGCAIKTICRFPDKTQGLDAQGGSKRPATPSGPS